MGSRLDTNGETASLKKRKRETKEEASPSLKRIRSKSNSKAANGAPDTPDRKAHSQPQPDSMSAKHADVDMELSHPVSASAEVAKTKFPGWKVSNPMGGRILDVDPIFSHDERSVEPHCQIVLRVC